MKIPIQNIYYLLSYAWNKLDQSKEEELNASDYKDLVNLLARVLITGCKSLLKAGLNKSYIEHTEEYNGIKGKINFKESLNHNLFKQGKAICVFDEFSVDVLNNQIIKTILRRLVQIEALEKKQQDEVWQLYFKFAGVSEINLSLNDFNRVRIHRNNASYYFILKVCQLIFENTVLNDEKGTYTFTDFTRDDKAMAYLFEEFVRNFYAREQTQFKVRREDIQWDASPIGESDLSLLPKMQTDISLESKDRKIIIETKFYQQTLSLNHAEKFHSANLYQLYSYLKNERVFSMKAYKKSEGILLYPLVEKKLNENYIIDGQQIKVVTIDLAAEWSQISDDLLLLLQNREES